MTRFLAIHRLPAQGQATWRETLTRIAEAARESGVRPAETFYNAERGLAYTFYEAPDADAIRAVHERAGAHAPEDMLDGERIFTELLAEPRRERYA